MALVDVILFRAMFCSMHSVKRLSCMEQQSQDPA